MNLPHSHLGPSRPEPQYVRNDDPVARLCFRALELWLARHPHKVVSWRISRDAYEAALAAATDSGGNSIAISVELGFGLSSTTPIFERTKLVSMPFVIDDELPPNSLIAVYDDQ